MVIVVPCSRIVGEPGSACKSIASGESSANRIRKRSNNSSAVSRLPAMSIQYRFLFSIPTPLSGVCSGMESASFLSPLSSGVGLM